MVNTEMPCFSLVLVLTASRFPAPAMPSCQLLVSPKLPQHPFSSSNPPSSETPVDDPLGGVAPNGNFSTSAAVLASELRTKASSDSRKNSGTVLEGPLLNNASPTFVKPQTVKPQDTVY
ncbi:hypothetical protein B0T20DRAFT_400018 [Sordaria brevicollis]|uniref:Uncharacterized protein n=1 Tax=Sordaria brevicollis TaxID=83679 RepID=A0AAE0UGA7_SORBR|nr:hypothetical protein B0T20DRAFT_400018 [Sordaria brevicollis]